MEKECEFTQWSSNTVRGIEESNVFLSFYTKDYERDPITALQLGTAILLDKPIYLLVEKGKDIPENLKKIAIAIDYYDGKDDMIRAAYRLTELLKERGMV